MSETEDKIQPDVFQLSFNARTLVNATVDFLNSAGEKVGKILVSVDNMLQNFGNEVCKFIQKLWSYYAWGAHLTGIKMPK